MNINNLNKGLVGHWTMSQDSLKSSTVLSDQTPYENDGTIYGATFTNDRKGQPNQAMSFDGVDDYIDFGKKGLNFGNNQTISFWIKTSENSSRYKRIFAMDSGNIYPYTIGFRSSRIEFTDENNIGEKGFPITLNQWNHIVIIPGGLGDNSCSCFLNGSIVIATATSNGYVFSDRTSIGSKNSSAGTFFNGLIDDVRIYNRALSEDEITLLYESYKSKIKL